MQELRLNGHFSYIDKFDKLKFTYIDESTKEKLILHCIGSNKPYRDDEFTVSLPKNIKKPPQDIRDKIGLDCVVHVKLHKYSLVSKLESNPGETVDGVQLILSNIRLQ